MTLSGGWSLGNLACSECVTVLSESLLPTEAVSQQPLSCTSATLPFWERSFDESDSRCGGDPVFGGVLLRDRCCGNESKLLTPLLMLCLLGGGAGGCT